MEKRLGPSFVTFASDLYGGGGAALQLCAPVLFYSLPLATALCLPFAHHLLSPAHGIQKA